MPTYNLPTPPDFAATHPSMPIIPIFIPFAGCPQQCIFCAQDIQTNTPQTSLATTLHTLTNRIEQHWEQQQSPVEIGLFGGTFTGLPHVEQERILHLLAQYKTKGYVARIRCSTRPDYINPEQLIHLQKLGLDMIELGIQSFQDAPLSQSQRGYTGALAVQACQHITASGLDLGIQLMPGMPGMSPEDFHHDMQECTRHRPQALRLYPCLVLTGTALTTQWQQGKFSPWSLDMVLPLLVDAQLLAWEHNIPIIRMGLAPEEGLAEAVLAGPQHPALGNIIRSRALFHYITQQLAPFTLQERPHTLHLPARLQGDFWGHAKELRQAYAQHGITPQTIRWHNAQGMTLHLL